MNKRQTKRLLNVARALREADSETKKFFSMATWGYSGDLLRDQEASCISSFTEESHPKCGTPACALGHYASRRDLQKQFSLTKKGLIKGFPEYTGLYRVLKRAASHFGISVEEAEELFGAGGCGDAKKPIEAARYIERFVKVSKTLRMH